jgi:hypothetical protein
MRVNQQYVHLLVLLIIAGSSFFGWLFRTLREQAAKKRALDAAERQKLDALRTGPRIGDPAPSSDSIVNPLEEAARRRREQIERARAAVRATAPAQAPPSTPAQPAGDLTIRLPNGAVLRLPGNAPSAPTPAGNPAPAAPAPSTHQDTRSNNRSQPQIAAKPPTPARTRQPARPVRSSNAPPRPGDPPPQLGRLSTRPTETIEVPAELTPISSISAISAVAAPPTVRASILNTRTMTPADWRRVIMTNEVLREPISLRAPGNERIEPI